MAATIDVESTLTDRYQTTIPGTVRRALALGKRDKVRYAIRTNGEVVLSRVGDMDDKDPGLEPFLDFLARDMRHHPERLQAVDAELVARLQSLVGEVEIDLDAPLPPDGE